jgi:hypothetical protein
MVAPANPPDDLEAVRAVVDALRAFPADDQRRILRWAQEKLGLPGSSVVPTQVATATPTEEGGATTATSLRSRDIRTFLQEKRPSSDNEFAAAVAYYFAFEAPDAEKKSEIKASDLQHAARLSGRQRLKRPIVTLHNASKRGYLDKGRGRGSFRINTVGENLVAMTMPGLGGADAAVPGRRPRARSPRRRRQVKKR